MGQFRGQKVKVKVKVKVKFIILAEEMSQHPNGRPHKFQIL